MNRPLRRLPYAVFAAVLAAVATSSVTGCCKVTMIDDHFVPMERHEKWLDFFVLGSMGPPGLDVRRYCGDAPARVAVEESAWTVGATAVTLGMYAPKIAAIECARPTPANGTGSR